MNQCAGVPRWQTFTGKSTDFISTEVIVYIGLRSHGHPFWGSVFWKLLEHSLPYLQLESDDLEPSKGSNLFFHPFSLASLLGGLSLREVFLSHSPALLFHCWRLFSKMLSNWSSWDWGWMTKTCPSQRCLHSWNAYSTFYTEGNSLLQNVWLDVFCAGVCHQENTPPPHHPFWIRSTNEWNAWDPCFIVWGMTLILSTSAASPWKWLHPLTESESPLEKDIAVAHLSNSRGSNRGEHYF